MNNKSLILTTTKIYLLQTKNSYIIQINPYKKKNLYLKFKNLKCL